MFSEVKPLNVIFMLVVPVLVLFFLWSYAYTDTGDKLQSDWQVEVCHTHPSYSTREDPTPSLLSVGVNRLNYTLRLEDVRGSTDCQELPQRWLPLQSGELTILAFDMSDVEAGDTLQLRPSRIVNGQRMGEEIHWLKADDDGFGVVRVTLDGDRLLFK